MDATVVRSRPKRPATERRIVTIPNAISVLRLALAVPIASLLLRGAYGPAFVLILIATSTDALDGFLARRLNQISALGRVLDPIADKAVILTAASILAWGAPSLVNDVPGWIPAALIARDVLAMTGAALGPGGLENVNPSRWGKAATALGDLAIVIAVGLEAAQLRSGVVPAVLAASVVASLISLAGYAAERFGAPAPQPQ